MLYLFFNKILDGSEIAIESISQHNKKSLSLLAITLLIFSLTLIIITQNLVPSVPLFDQLFENYNKLALFALTLFFTIIAWTIMRIIITSHTINIINTKYKAIQQKVSNFQIKTGAILALISFIFYVFLISIYYMLTKLFPGQKIFTNTIMVIIFLAWQTISLFAIQAITIDNLSIFNSIKKSIYISCNTILEYLATIFFLIIFIFLIPVLFSIRTSNRMLGETSPESLYNHRILALIIASIIFLYALEASKTLLFNNFKQKNS